MDDRTAAAASTNAVVAAVAAITGNNTTTVSIPTSVAANGSVYPSPVNQAQSLPASLPNSEGQSPLNQLPPLTHSQQATPTLQPLYTPTPTASEQASRGPATPTSVSTPMGQMPNFAAAAVSAVASTVAQASQQATSTTTQPAARNGVYSLAPQQQYPAPPTYTTSMMSASTPAISHPQPIAPALVSRNTAPMLRPLPHASVMHGGVPGYAANTLLTGLPEGEPTHVVGSQGRRGILPSAPGRPSVSQMSGKGAIIPQKDADGKFPCPHCTKTYLHAKHLKRHLLRHTGDRPYMCVLCRDTFSRSDILKRHFQKCSIRRGNPTGVSHLSHPQAHVKKNQQKQAHLADAGDMSHLNGLGSIQDGMVHPFSAGMVPVTNPLGGLSDQIAASVMASGARPFDQTYGADVSVSMPTQSLTNYSMTQPGLSMYSTTTATTQQSGLDWAQMFQSGAHNNLDSLFANSLSPNTERQKQTARRPDNDRRDDVTIPSPYPPSANGINSIGNDLQSQAPHQNNKNNDTFQHLSRRILQSIYPAPNIEPTHSVSAAVTFHSSSTSAYTSSSSSHIPSSTTPRSFDSNHGQPTGLEAYFTPENVKDFLANYSHFNVHFPIIHAPTFKVTDAITPLLIALCCIGAAYSNLVKPSDVRDMTSGLRFVVERECDIISLRPTSQPPRLVHCASKLDIEMVQATSLFITLCSWNGSREDRAYVRSVHPLFSDVIRRSGILQVSQPGQPGYSILHQPDMSVRKFDVSSFNWEAWVNQERRLRTCYMALLGDTGFAFFYNSPAQFDCFDCMLPLPADDAAWDAETPEACLAALGLLGLELAQEYNPDGTKQATQPGMTQALRTLMHSDSTIQPGITNLYGKFILIHAILALICDALGESLALECVDQKSDDENDAACAPLQIHDENPVTLIPHETLKAFYVSLDKFKSNWDLDMVTQFPPSVGPKNPRRLGFVRDGIHFYWLCKYFLKYSRADDLRASGEVRLRQVIGLLRSVRSWVLTDGASRGEELGSVSEIGEYETSSDDSFNMSELFRPLQDILDDPRVVKVKTNLPTSGDDYTNIS